MKEILSGFLLISSLCAISQTILAEHHFEEDGISEVSVSGIFCDVNVTRGSKVVFDGRIEGDGDSGDYVIASIRNGSTVVFKVERKKNRDWGWNDIDLARLDLELPAGVSLKIDNTSGDVNVADYESDMLRVEVTSGDVYLKEIKASCKVSATSGDISIRNVQGDVAMRSTSGDQEFYGVVGNLKTGATSGDIEINRLVGSLDVSATSGDIEIDELEGTINAATTSGNIDGEMIMLSGESRFKSTSGDIAINVKNDLEKIGFDLRASSGDLEVGRLEGDDRLVIKRGAFTVTGISTSGDQRYTD